MSHVDFTDTDGSSDTREMKITSAPTANFDINISDDNFLNVNFTDLSKDDVGYIES